MCFALCTTDKILKNEDSDGFEVFHLVLKKLGKRILKMCGIPVLITLVI